MVIMENDNIIRKQHTGQAGNGGEFGNHCRDDADVGLKIPSAASVIAGIVARDERFSLIFIDYDDSLTDEQSSQYLAGDGTGVQDKLAELFSDHVWDSATEAAERACTSEGLNWDDLDEDDRESLRDAIGERDDSDPLSDLLRVTHDKLMRAPICKIGAEATSTDTVMLYGSSPEIFELRVSFMSRKLAEHGVDITAPGVDGAIRDLVSEGPSEWHEGVDLDVIWYGPIGDAALTRSTNIEQESTLGRRLSFPSPEIVLIDRYTGQGYSTTLPTPITVVVTPDVPADLDNQISGYGWDLVAGVYKPAFRQDVASEWVEKELAAII